MGEDNDIQINGEVIGVAVAPYSVLRLESLLGIQNVRTLEAAANMARRGAHFKHQGTPIWLLQHATCRVQNQSLVIFCTNMLKIIRHVSAKYKNFFC